MNALGARHLRRNGNWANSVSQLPRRSRGSWMPSGYTANARDGSARKAPPYTLWRPARKTGQRGPGLIARKSVAAGVLEHAARKQLRGDPDLHEHGRHALDGGAGLRPHRPQPQRQLHLGPKPLPPSPPEPLRCGPTACDIAKATKAACCDAPRTCRGITDCTELRVRFYRGGCCVGARRAVTQLCFDHVWDVTHRKKMQSAIEVTAECARRIKKDKCKFFGK